MKKNKILLVCALALGLPSAVSNLMHNVEPIVARAEEETTLEFNIATIAKENNWSNSVQYSTLPTGNDELEITATGKVNTGKYYSKGSTWRIYQNESPKLFISSKNLNIKSITLNYKSDKGGVAIYNENNYTTGANIIVNSNSASITVGSTKNDTTNGNIQITSIKVVLVSTDTSKYTISFDSNEGTFNAPDKWKTITSEIGSETEIILPTKDEITTPYNGLLELIGWTDGDATYNPGEKLKVSESKTFKAVYKTNLTIEEALLIIEETGTTTTKFDFTISGKITEIKYAYSSKDNIISVVISDGTNELYVFKMQGGENLSVGDYIKVTGNLINYKGTTPEINSGSTFVMDSISAFNAVETKTNLKFNYNETTENNVTTYSDFNNVQIQYQYTFDTTKYTNAQEIGIYVTDDEKFDFDTTGIYDDNEFTFDKMKADAANSHKFVNSSKKETYTVGINLGELNEDSIYTKFMACAYVKIDGKYYFAGKSSQYDMFDLLDAYSKKDDLDETSKKIVSAFNTYLEGFLL